MAWAPLLLTLLTYCSGVSSQPMVTQEPSMSVSPGGAVTLSCSLSTGAITTGNYPGWFQQKPGSAPQQLIYDTNSRPLGIPARFSGSISGNKAALTITGVLAEDEADYYCILSTAGFFQRCLSQRRVRPTARSGAPHSCTTASSQPVLTQPPSVTTSPGQTVKISCSMSSGFTVQSYPQSWQQQKSGSPPRYLLSYYNSMSRGSGVPDRFSGSKESSSNVWYLTITSVQAEDEADYSCAVWYG
ncbi:uncharacterized protein, partial [Emydura macquarii macquarii]|uniref:uncharacterized protein n=1 Tax=Emydura macquarii macquarii TaxID=1129001 RepID=UPI00352A6FE6